LAKRLALVLGTAIGIPIGVWLLTYINPGYVRFGVGVLLVLYAIYSLAQPVFKPIKIGTVADIVIGTFNGLLGGLTGLGALSRLFPASCADGQRTCSARYFSPCCWRPSSSSRFR
jgi:uncharacterized membrane protein YfcA